jgi:hypothetical protein
MPELKKVTLRFDPAEDRICMMAEPRDNKPILFWLTMRICRQLVPLLCGHLERTTPKKPVISHEIQLSCMQREAEWKFQSSKPVEMAGDSSMVTPSRIDYTFDGEVTALSFPVEGAQNVDLKLSLLELRQFLALLHRLFQRAGWPMDVWPAWFTVASPAAN